MSRKESWSVIDRGMKFNEQIEFNILLATNSVDLDVQCLNLLVELTGSSVNKLEKVLLLCHTFQVNKIIHN